jgi:hypothetical protein
VGSNPTLTALNEMADEAGLPKGFADFRYSIYKEQLIEISRKDVIQAFKWVESTSSSAKNAAEGSKAFNKQKLIYIQQFKKAVKNAIRNNKIMNAIVGFNYSDRILLFKSTVKVNTSGKLNVIEEITIYNGDGQSRGTNYQTDLNDEIKRGIRREFPTKYTDNNGFLKIVPFNITSVKRNGENENYFEEPASNGVVLYIGREDYYLPNGIYTYRIEYETAEQMVFLENYDEVYWNVTGNGWSFNIDSVVCTIIFPEPSKIIQQDCYTGFFGAGDKDCGYNILNDSTILFHSTTGFDPYQGLTVAAAIPKGIVETQSEFANIIDFLLDNLTIPFIAVIFLLVFIINYIVWHRVGRDPKKGTIYPQFEPPSGLSPPEVGYIVEQNYKPKLAAAALIDAAVNRHIAIDVKNEGLIFKQNVYYINKSETTKPVKTDYHSFGDSHYIDSIEKIKKGDYNSSSILFFERS